MSVKPWLVRRKMAVIVIRKFSPAAIVRNEGSIRTDRKGSTNNVHYHITNNLSAITNLQSVVGLQRFPDKSPTIYSLPICACIYQIFSTHRQQPTAPRSPNREALLWSRAGGVARLPARTGVRHSFLTKRRYETLGE